MWPTIFTHWCFDMTGGISMWCILKGCQNPAHQHRAVVAWLGRSPWLFQAVFALAIAIATVRLVG